jgi:hypothetical protein
MTTSTIKIACALLAFAAAARAEDAAKTKTAGKGEPVFLNVKEIKWSEAPPDLPKGAQAAVLHGDPSKAGSFTLRFKFPDGYKIAPHWHAQDEELTVLSGTFVLHMGDTMKSEAHTLETGGYHYLPGKMHHAGEVKGETVLELHGKGPFDLHYVNPADNPNPKTATK